MDGDFARIAERGWTLRKGSMMKKFTYEEKIIAKNIDKKYKWMARNKKSGNLIVFARKPYKDPVFERWTYNLPIPICSIPVFNDMFKSVTWEDAEPTLIKDIYDPQILNDAEKKYLTAVLKPLPEVESIQKIVSPPINNAFLAISFYSKETMCFPFFEEGSMYNGIEVGKAYTPEELGIEV